MFTRLDAIQSGNNAILDGIQLLEKSVAQLHPPVLVEPLSTIQERIDQVLNKIPIPFREEIMSWLNFRQKHWRYEEVDTAFKATFKWIFETQKPAEWDNFREYLMGTGISTPYFIHGKAGSGKSTLMKFIVRDPATEQALRCWAGHNELLILKFFFWNFGTPLQKSAVGMLRTLVHGILTQYPELLLIAFPEMCPRWLQEGDEPTYNEMKNALERLTSRSASFLKLCIFVDGIDEYEGDHRDMSDFLRSIVCPHIKLIVSSRPINPYVMAFRGCPSLGLQDLTKTDIDHYVHRTLSSHELMKGLLEYYPIQAQLLVSGIQKKAEGVFLWVKLVVRLLIEGLEDGDSIEDLQRKLDSLPTDQRQLYQRMMDRIHPDHQRQASEIFQIFQAWQTISRDLSALLLVWALFPRPTQMEMKPSLVKCGWVGWQLRRVEAQLRSRCCGLIEIRRQGSQWEHIREEQSDFDTDVMDIARVRYMHHTVAEFLASIDVREEIYQKTQNTGFVPCLHLAGACITMINIATNYASPSVFTYLNFLIRLFHVVTGPSANDIRLYCLHLDEAMTALWNRSDRINGAVESERTHWSAEMFWERQDFILRNHVLPLASIYTFAARCSLLQFFEAKIPDETPQSLYAIVSQAIESWRFAPSRSKTSTEIFQVSTRKRVATLDFLLRKIAGPETKEWGRTLWQYGLIICADLMMLGKREEACELVAVLLRNAQHPASLRRETTRHYSYGEVSLDRLFAPMGPELLRLIIPHDDVQYESLYQGGQNIIVFNDERTIQHKQTAVHHMLNFYG